MIDKTTASPQLEELFVEGSSFSIQLDQQGNPHLFTVVLVLDGGTLICRVENSKVDTFITKKAVEALFPVGEGVYSVRLLVERQAVGGQYVAITPTAQPVLLQQRRSFRLKTDSSISYRIQFDEVGNLYRGAIEDISDGGLGLFVYAARGMKKGATVTISIQLSRHSEPMVVRGEVAHCTKHPDFARAYRVGIRFTDIRPQYQQAINAYIKERAARGGAQSA